MRTFYSFLDDLQRSIFEQDVDTAQGAVEHSKKSELMTKINNILSLAEGTDDSLRSFKKSFGTITDEQDKFYETVRSSLLEINNKLIELQSDINKVVK